MVLEERKKNMYVRNPEEIESLGFKNGRVKGEDRISYQNRKAFNSRQLWELEY